MTTSYTRRAVARFKRQVTMPLVLEFLVAFSRFEHALKEAGFLEDKRSQEEKDRGVVRDGSANWDAYAACLREAYQQDRSPDLVAAVDYLVTKSPIPKRQ